MLFEVWGKDMGCNFINNKCIDPTTGVAMGENEGYFCTVKGSSTCSVDKKYKSVCDVVEYQTDITESFYQYFPSDKKKGGSKLTMDYCPMYKSYSNQNCMDATHVSTQNARGEIYGTESRCFHSNLIQSKYQDDDTVVQTCFQRTCQKDGGVKISATTGTATVDVICSENDEGTKKSLSGFTGTIICPNVQSVCQDLKPAISACSHRGSTGSTSSNNNKDNANANDSDGKDDKDDSNAKTPSASTTLGTKNGASKTINIYDMIVPLIIFVATYNSFI
jgi:nitrite reductase/ring-hydroxylating ferredoxin subunit